MRNLGYSMFDIFVPIAISIFSLGLIFLLLVNPLSVFMEKIYDQKINNNNESLYSIKISENQMWIKNNIDQKNSSFMRLAIPAFLIGLSLTTTASFSAEHNSKQLFNDLVQPVLNAKCASCHGAEKQKGKLRIDSYADIMKGGSEGEGVIPGNDQDSSILYRVYLPLEDDLASVAYWYQLEPHNPFPDLPAKEQLVIKDE